MKFNRTILLKRFFAFFAILVVLFLVAQSTILPGVIERVIHQAFRQVGMPVQHLKIRSVFWSQADFSSVILGKDNELKIDSLQIDYDLYSLLRGHLNSIRISGAQYETWIDKKSILRASSGIRKSNELFTLSVDEIDISSTSILFKRNKAQFRVPFSGHIKKEEDQIHFVFDVELLGGAASLFGSTTHELQLTALNVDVTGLNPGVLPTDFLPSILTAPLQGMMQGKCQAKRTGGTLTINSDLSFRLAGEYNNTPFHFDQVRLKNTIGLTADGHVTPCRADLSIEQVAYAHYIVNNLSTSVTNEQQTLYAYTSANGRRWDFKAADSTLVHYEALLQHFLPIENAPDERPCLSLRVHGLNNRINKLRVSAEEIDVQTTLDFKDQVLQLSDTSIRVKEGRLAQGTMLIQGINTDVSIEEFFPLTTHGSQKLHIQKATFGDIQLSNGTLLFQTESHDQYRIERMDWTWCNGRLSCRPFTYAPARPETQVSVFFEDVSLTSFLRTTHQEKMMGNGHLYGRVPVRLRNQPDIMLSFGKGHLYTVPSYGTVQIHDPEIITEILMGSTMGQQADRQDKHNKQIAEAIKDYHYSTLKINFDRIRSNGLSGDIHLRDNTTSTEQLSMGLTIPFYIQ